MFFGWVCITAMTSVLVLASWLQPGSFESTDLGMFTSRRLASLGRPLRNHNHAENLARDRNESGIKGSGFSKAPPKGLGWFATCSALVKALQRTCSHVPEAHIRIEGKLTSGTAVYPRELCRKYANCIMNPGTEWQQLCARATCYHRDDAADAANPEPDVPSMEELGLNDDGEESYEVPWP